MYEQIKNVNKEIEIIKRNQTESLELKSIITEIKSLQGFNGRFENAK